MKIQKMQNVQQNNQSKKVSFQKVTLIRVEKGEAKSIREAESMVRDLLKRKSLSINISKDNLLKRVYNRFFKNVQQDNQYQIMPEYPYLKEIEDSFSKKGDDLINDLIKQQKISASQIHKKGFYTLLLFTGDELKLLKKNVTEPASFLYSKAILESQEKQENPILALLRTSNALHHRMSGILDNTCDIADIAFKDYKSQI